jgi:23S rRNA G2069 N7-methylase RlmK/C1962 C5-methylase RlmI
VEQRQEFYGALNELFNKSEYTYFEKVRKGQSPEQQYEKLDRAGDQLIIKEGPCRFYVNLSDYLDTGLFLDQRPLRTQMDQYLVGDKFLNLFCYTATVSVAAAMKGAQTLNVYLSNTYLNWAQDNFNLNQIPIPGHEFVKADVLQWVEKLDQKQKFTTIYLDPPTFSQSKSMQKKWSVGRDHAPVIDKLMNHLEEEGQLLFCTNLRDFKLDQSILDKFDVNNVTKRTIPEDFRDQKIHHFFIIKRKSQ